MTKKVYQPYEFNSELKVEEVLSLPTWKATDKRRLLRVSGSGLFFGGETSWIKVADSEHNHDSTYAQKTHSHGDFSLAGHNHNDSYAAKSHTHSYAATNHNHNTVYAAKSHSHNYAATSHSHTSLANSLKVSGNLTCTADMKPKRLVVNGKEVVDASGFIDYARIKNHPSYCSSDCNCNCGDNL
ncbi:MAG: hypothetical protein MI863_05200 [Desulfobacterales bacterium]|nr:hypothetical protein [Desulfobacterales bacterium]